MVELRSGRLTAFEVLARWEHPTAGLLLPDQFIPQAEEQGWLGDLTCVLLRRALLEIKAVGQPVEVALNLSPLQLLDRHLPEMIETIARETAFSLERLTLEITETAFAADRPRALAIASELKDMGCKLSLDDFGTGYSSLVQLQSLPFDEIKIDQSFVSSMLERRGSRKIVSAIVSLGQSLGIRNVAEGIETHAQAEMLRWLGCDLGQGWLYGRPAPATDLRSQMDRPRRILHRHAPVSPGELCLETPAERLAQLQAVYDGAPVGLAFLDKDLRYRNLNERMARMNGIPVQKHLGRTVCEVLPDIFPMLAPYLQRALAGESVPNVELLMRASSQHRACTRWFSYQPVRDEAGDVIGVSIAVMFITRNEQRRVARFAAEEYGTPLAAHLTPQVPGGLHRDATPQRSLTTR